MNIIQNIIPTIEYYIENYGALGVFLASIIEEIIPPIPSALVQGLGGLLIMLNEPFSLLGFLKLMVLVSIPAALGVCIGSLPYWYLAQKYGVELIEKYGKYLGTNIHDWHKLQERMEKSKSDEYIFIALRAFPAVPAIVLAIYAGTVNMKIQKYFYLSFLGIFIRATVLGSIGWLAGNQILKHITFFIQVIEKVTLTAIVLFFVYMVYKNYFKKKNK